MVNLDIDIFPAPGRRRDMMWAYKAIDKAFVGRNNWGTRRRLQRGSLIGVTGYGSIAVGQNTSKLAVESDCSQ